MDTEIIKSLITEGQEVVNTHYNERGVIGFPNLDTKKYAGWRTRVLNYASSQLESNSQYYMSLSGALNANGYRGHAEKGIGVLVSLLEDVNNGLVSTRKVTISNVDPLDPVFNIMNKFHSFTRQLRHRYNSQPTLDIADEYDVQDALHALLRLYYDDIRAEEWCPSYAGKCSRMDFLLQDFNTVIEVKKTRRGLSGKEIGSQLIEDIARYQQHPFCNTLICFVYDPEGLISNPKGIENDLSKLSERIQVRVVIRPLN